MVENPETAPPGFPSPDAVVADATPAVSPAERLLTLSDVLRLLDGVAGRSKVLEHIRRLRTPGRQRSRILLRWRDYERLVDSLAVGLAEAKTNAGAAEPPNRHYEAAVALLGRGTPPKPGPGERRMRDR